MDVDEPTAKAVGGEILPMIFVVSKAIEYIKNQILDRVVSRVDPVYMTLHGVFCLFFFLPGVLVCVLCVVCLCHASHLLPGTKRGVTRL